MGFAKECWPFVLPFLGLAALLLATGQPRWSLVTTLLALVILFFFRIPSRSDSAPLDAILSPASGKILRLDTLQDPDIGPGDYHRVVIFLSVFNVHVQRAPLGGTVIVSSYTPGRKLPAFNAQAGEVNEQLLTVIRRSNGELVGIRQIAGLLARRVVSYLEVDEKITRGQLMGVIKFGSRVDLMLPSSYPLQVEVGQKLVEGETIVALNGIETP